MMTEKLKKNRYKWEIDNVTWYVSDWKEVEVSNEKRFCDGGPGGFSLYWNDLRYEPQFFRSVNKRKIDYAMVCL